jgi:hypothetical protein
VAREFLPLRRLIGTVQGEIRHAAADLSEPREGVAFVIGECNISLSLELDTDGDQTFARFPSIGEEGGPPAEQLSRVTLTLRPMVPFIDK